MVYYTDPSCTGRPVQDTFGVAWPEMEESIWWKTDFQKYDPGHYQGLLKRVVEHLNEGTLSIVQRRPSSSWMPAIPFGNMLWAKKA